MAFPPIILRHSRHQGTLPSLPPPGSRPGRQASSAGGYGGYPPSRRRLRRLPPPSARARPRWPAGVARRESPRRAAHDFAAAG
eukprot:6578597-Prymnesium_polylepis.4